MNNKRKLIKDIQMLARTMTMQDENKAVCFDEQCLYLNKLVKFCPFSKCLFERGDRGG